MATKKIPVEKTEAPEKALKDIMKRLIGEGASAVRLIDASGIVVDDRVRLKCRIPLCDSYNKNLMCPPHVPSLDEFRKALARYDGAMLIQIVTPLAGARNKRPHADVYAPAKRLHEMINRAEKWAFEKNFRFATGLIGGCCRLCDDCAAVTSGAFCRHPFQARPSMEAMGIDVVETVNRAGLSTRFPIVSEVTWTGVVLF
jgi:predicted metal-binding protein